MIRPMNKRVWLLRGVVAGAVGLAAGGLLLWTARPLPVPAALQRQLAYIDATCRGLMERIAVDIEADLRDWDPCDIHSGRRWREVLDLGGACGLDDGRSDPFPSWVGWLTPNSWPEFRRHWDASLALRPPRWVGGACPTCRPPAWMVVYTDPPPECRHRDRADDPWWKVSP